MSESGATYGSGQLKLSALKKDAKSFDQMLTNAFDIKRNSEPGSAEYIKAEADMAAIRKEQLEGSIALKIAIEQNKTKGNPSTSFYQNTLKQGMLEIENKYKSDLVTGPDGQPIDPMKKDAFKTQAILDYKKKFVDNLVREGIDTNGLTVIQSDPQLNNIYKDVLKAEQDKITGDGDTSEENKVIKKPKKAEQFTTIIDNNPVLNVDTVRLISELYPTMEGKDLYTIITKKYPKKDAESQSDYTKRVGGFIKSISKEKYEKEQINKVNKKQIDDSLTYDPKAKQIVGNVQGNNLVSENGRYFLETQDGRRIKTLNPAEAESYLKKINKAKTDAV